MRLRNRCVGEVLVRCLHQNAAMMHLAQKYGMKIQQDGTDREARLELPAATTGTYFYCVIKYAIIAALANS